MQLEDLSHAEEEKLDPQEAEAKADQRATNEQEYMGKAEKTTVWAGWHRRR